MISSEDLKVNYNRLPPPLAEGKRVVFLRGIISFVVVGGKYIISNPCSNVRGSCILYVIVLSE